MFVIVISFGTYVSFRFQDIAGDFETALDIPFNRASGIHVNIVMQYTYLSLEKKKNSCQTKNKNRLLRAFC